MNLRPALACVLAATAPLALSALVAAGQPAAAKLDYKTDPDIEGCPTTQAVRQALAAKLGYDPFVEPAEHEILLRVGRVGGGIRGSLVLEGPRAGRREIDSPSNDCREVVDALIVAAAIAIDPAVLLRPPSSASSGPPPPPPPSSSGPAPKPPRTSRPAPPTSTSPRSEDSEGSEAEAPPYSVFVGNSYLVGDLPDNTLAFAFGGRMRLGWGSLTLSYHDTQTFQKDQTISSASGGHGELSLMAVNLIPCGHSQGWSGCLLGSLGVMHAEGLDLDLPKRTVRRTAAVGALVGHDWQITGLLYLGVFGGASVPLVRTTVNIDGEEVWKTPVLTGRLGGRLMFSF